MAYRLRDLTRPLPGIPRGDSKPVPRLRPEIAAWLRRRLDENDALHTTDRETS